MSHVLTNIEKYQKLVDALNDFYWDNGIQPHMTAALLEKFAGDVNRLAQFIRDNRNEPDPRSPTLRAAVRSEQNGAEYCTCQVTPRIDGICVTCGLPRAPHSNRSGGG